MVTIYILKCKQDKYYVGKIASNVWKRIKQHFDGKGAKWTQKYKPIDILDIRRGLTDRDESKTIYLDDIPDSNQEITIDNMDKIEVEKRSTISGDKTTYILCQFKERNRTFLFNESQDIFSESVGIEEIMLEKIKYSSTHIYGELENEEILINRVSGEITSSIGNTRPQLGMCELLDSRKF